MSTPARQWADERGLPKPETVDEEFEPSIQASWDPKYDALAEWLGDRTTVAEWLHDLRLLGLPLDGGARTLDELVQNNYNEDGSCETCQGGPADAFCAFCAFCWDFSTHHVLNTLAAMVHLVEFRDGAFRLREAPGLPCGCCWGDMGEGVSE